MKKMGKIFVFFVSFVAWQGGAETRTITVDDAPFPFSVTEWTPPARTFPITAYGAKPSGAPVTEALDKAVAAAHAAGGGRVTVPAGEWPTGAFKLKSGVALVVEDGAVLRFLDDPVVAYRRPLGKDGRPVMTQGGLVQAVGCTNVAIMGAGTLKADVAYWHSQFMLDPKRGFPRPQFFKFTRCKNVRFEGFKIRGSPAWTMHFTLCEDVVLRGLDSVCSGPNTDGIDLESCDRALVEDCSLDQTDDTYTIKSGFNEAGRKRNRPTQNVVIRRCKTVQGHALLAIGSEVSGGVRNIWMTDCSVEADCWNWLSIKTNAKRGGYIENVTVENIRGRRAGQAVMNVEMFYDGNPNKELTKAGGPRWCTRIDGITLRNVVCEEAAYAVRVRGDAALPPKRLKAEDIRIGRTGTAGEKGLLALKHAPDFTSARIRLDPAVAREILDLPPNVRVLDTSADASASDRVSFDRVVCEELSENEILRRVFEQRVAVETATGRTCAPRVTPFGIDQMPEALEGGHVRRVYRLLIDAGCALPGAVVADDVRRVGAVGADGTSATFPGLSLAVAVSRAQGYARVTFRNGSPHPVTNVWGMVCLPPEWMTRRHLFRAASVAAGETLVRTFPLGAAAHYLPGPVGDTPCAAHVDFSSPNAPRARLWVVQRDPSPPLGFVPPNVAARYTEPVVAAVLDDARLSRASAETGPLPEWPGMAWKSPTTVGAAWYNVTPFSRPYTEAEKRLLRAGDLAEAFALQFRAPAKVAVRMRLLPYLWDRRAAVFLNGERVAVTSKYVMLPAREGVNRLVVRYRSRPGDRTACAQCSVNTWSVPEQLTCVPFPTAATVAPTPTKDGAATFPLEWNCTFDVSVPYEVEIEPAKIAPLVGGGDVTFSVSARGPFGDRPVPVVRLPGRTAKHVRLRFAVPAGTASLTCTARRGAGAATDADPDNLFAGALKDTAKWTLTPRCRAEVLPDGGLLIGAKDFGSPYAMCTVDVPPGCAGKPVVLDAELENIGAEAAVRVLRIEQLDGAGKKLPESVVDRRWTTHACPVGVKTRYLERGRIHPAAARVRAVVVVSSPVNTHDAYGRPQARDRARLAKHRMTRLSLRPAAQLPFPKYDDAFFAAGVSGRAGDCALRLGGEMEKGFWYQTRSQASWSDAVSLRDENLVFFPSRAGTVEAWFKSAWKATYGRNEAGARVCRAYRLFEAFQGFRASEMRAGRGRLISLSYRPDPGELDVFFREPTTRKEWTVSARVTLPAAAWCHVALQWTPKGSAEVFVDGRQVVTLAIPEWLGCDLQDEKIVRPNDENAQEFFLGCSCRAVRLNVDVPDDVPLLDGAVDLFRASTGTRYAGDFTPPKTCVLDDATRALFTFDRSFDGVSGGGPGWIPGTLRARCDRVDHTLRLDDGRRLAYWPAQPLPENDPANVFDIVNYPDLPAPADFEALRRPFRHEATLKPGETLCFEAPAGVTTDFTEIRNVSSVPLVLPILLNAGDLDPRSYGDIADSLALGGLSDRARADAIFRLVLSATDYFQIHSAKFLPETDKPRDTEYDCMTMLNGYCGFECGPMNHLTANLFAFAGRCPASETAGYGHQFEQVFYDGKNHIYDLSAQKFFPAWDNETAAYLEEAGDQPGVFNRMGLRSDHFIRMGHRGFWGIGLKTPAKIGLTLRPGEAFRVWQVNDGQCNDLIADAKEGVYRGGPSRWKKEMDAETHADTATHYIQRVERFFPHYLNGFITFDGAPSTSVGTFTCVTNDSFCYDVDAGGYPVTAADYRAQMRDGRAAAIEISTNGGRTFRPLAVPATYAVRARLRYRVRVKAPLAEVAWFAAKTEVQLNPRVFPGRIRTGANAFTLKAAAGGAARVTVAGREPAGRIQVAGKAVYSGTVKGAEMLFTAFDADETRTLSVTGISTVTAEASGAVRATWADGVLTLTAKDRTRTAFGAVRLRTADGAEKTLVAFTGPGVRFATAADATLKGPKVALKGPDATSPQARVVFLSHGGGESEAAFRIGPTPAGRYAVFNLNRFVSHPEQKAPDTLRMIWPGQNRPSYGCGSPRNNSCNFLKADYGRPGGRANFKWDYPYREQNRWGLYQSLMTVDVPAADEIRLFSWRKDHVDVAAVLAVPDPSVDVRAELIKVLCGFNTDPWRLAAAGDGVVTWK